jgi:protein-S-isoprenylcysteine O-methyltransferase Ste14
MTHGAYAVARHPAYFGICLIWLGLGAAFSSPPVLAIAVLFTIPVYVLYLRAEESMMLESFGDEYREYCRRVPMLIPRVVAKR